MAASEATPGDRKSVSDQEPREGRWQRRPRKARIGLWSYYWYLQLPFTVARPFLEGSPDRKWLFHLLVWIQVWLIAAGAVVFLLNELRIRRHGNIDKALSERPAGLTEYPVEAIIFVNDKPLGLDRGVIYFEEGRVGFVGSSFSFLLAANDLVNPREKTLIQKDLVISRLTLRTHGGGTAFLQIKPLLGYGRAYRKSLKRFFKEDKDVPGERQWPPVTKYRAVVSTDIDLREDEYANQPELAEEVVSPLKVGH